MTELLAPPPLTALEAGRRLLARPLLPLVRLLNLLYLTGPFATIEELLAQLSEPVETGGLLYPEPDQLLRPLLPELREMEKLKTGAAPEWVIADENGQPLSPLEALELWVNQAVLVRELEAINSLLCGPCHCTLCCTGPGPEMAQEFFTIPLTAAETQLFTLPITDTAASRVSDALAEPPLTVQGAPFYRQGPGLYHWRSGWSLVLPRATTCPQLAQDGRCRVYPERPQVCRRPQIFAYVIEEINGEEDGQPTAAARWRQRNALLAIWDCPYVRALQDEIGRFAELSGLEPIFRANKG